MEMVSIVPLCNIHKPSTMCPAELVEPSACRGWYTPCVTACRDDSSVVEPVTPLLPTPAIDVASPTTPAVASAASPPALPASPPSLEVCILLDYASQALLLDRLPAKHHVVAGDRLPLKSLCSHAEALLAPLGTRVQLAITAAATDQHCQVAMLKGLPRWLAATLDSPPHLVLSTVPGALMLVWRVQPSNIHRVPTHNHCATGTHGTAIWKQHGAIAVQP